MGWRLSAAVVLLATQMLGDAPRAHAATPTPRSGPLVNATWTPTKLISKDLSGVCPTDIQPEAPCQIQRGVTYQVTAAFRLDQASQPLTINVEPGGMQITATARSTGLDVTPALAANQSETIDLNITVPDQNPRGGDRSFYLARIRLGSPGQITGALVITVSIPKQRVTWGRLLLNDGTGNPAPLQAIVGSGRSFTRRVTFSANSEIPDFAIKSNSDRITVSAVPDVLAPNQQRTVVLTFNAPIVNRRTRMDVSLTPASGLSPLPTALRMKVIVNPAEITWGPPQVRATLNAETQELQEKTLTVVSNVDIPGVSFVTQDVGLVPILSPLDPVNLRAGVPQEVRMRLCPGYAPTTYFLGLTAYQGSKPLNQRLQIKMTVTGDAARIPALPPGAQDPCARR